MPHFVVVHPVAFKEQDLLAFHGRRGELPSSCVWRHSLIADDACLTFCEWDSLDKRQLREIFEGLGVPYTEIHEVRLFDPATRLGEVA